MTDQVTAHDLKCSTSNPKYAYRVKPATTLKVGNQPELRRVMARQPSVGGLPLTFVSGFSLGYKLYHILLFLFFFFLFFLSLVSLLPLIDTFSFSIFVKNGQFFVAGL